MTANGDGLNFDFLDDAASAKKPEPPAASPPVSLPEEASASEVSEGGLDEIDIVGEFDDEGSSSSIFDDSPEEPVNSVDEIPDALPNISGSDTEILVRGRTEVQDFTEDFGEVPDVTQAPEPPVVEDPPEEILDFGSMPPASTSVQGEFVPSASLQNPLGGLFLDQPDISDAPAPAPVEALSDTVVTEFSFTNRPAPESEVETSPPPPPVESTPESDDTHVTQESPAISLDGLNDSGLSLSSVTSAVTSAVASTGTAGARAVPAPPPKGNPLILIALGGYALVVTALCVMLLSMLAKARTASQLESLPDLKPIPPGKVAIYQINTELPAGHTLKLGEHQRYGNLRVEPIKVTRSPITFQHFSKDGEFKDYDSAPVLKLWVKFTNESKAQAFVPLDSDLLFRRHVDAQDTVRANNFLVHRVDKPRRYPLVFVYDHPLASDWDMVEQHLGQSLEPGESLETYIPTTEEGIDHLRGELLWRVQLRKGHSSGGYGVTTLVEVAFTADQIQSDGT